MSLTHETTHATAALARLCEQFKGNAGIRALLNAGSVEVQAIEDALWQLQTLRLPITAATGAQLDGIGDIVGQPRSGMADDLYTLWLQAKMLANASTGVGETLLAIATLIKDPYTTLVLEQQPPAGLLLTFASAPEQNSEAISRILASAVAGGVNLQMVYSLASPDDLTFATGDVTEVSGNGLADLENLVQNSDPYNWAGTTPDRPDDWTVTEESLGHRELSPVDPGVGHGGGLTGDPACNFYDDDTGGLFLSLSQLLVHYAGQALRLTFDMTYVGSGALRVVDARNLCFDETFSTVATHSIDFIVPEDTQVELTFECDGITDITIYNIQVSAPSSGGALADVRLCDGN